MVSLSRKKRCTLRVRSNFAESRVVKLDSYANGVVVDGEKKVKEALNYFGVVQVPRGFVERGRIAFVRLTNDWYARQIARASTWTDFDLFRFFSFV